MDPAHRMLVIARRVRNPFWRWQEMRYSLIGVIVTAMYAVLRNITQYYAILRNVQYLRRSRQLGGDGPQVLTEQAVS